MCIRDRGIISGQLQIILDRYPDEPNPGIERLVNVIVAPTVFRILFATAPLEVEELYRLVDMALDQ